MDVLDFKSKTISNFHFSLDHFDIFKVKSEKTVGFSYQKNFLKVDVETSMYIFQKTTCYLHSIIEKKSYFVPVFP